MGQAALNILPGTAQLLVEGGDKRIKLDPLRGVNRYGCGSTPDPDLLDFSSATASVISTAAFEAAGWLRKRLGRDIRCLTPAAVYARELARMRRELLTLCALGDLPEPDIIFAASGTDLHRIAAQLAQAAPTSQCWCSWWTRRKPAAAYWPPSPILAQPSKSPGIALRKADHLRAAQARLMRISASLRCKPVPPVAMCCSSRLTSRKRA